MGCGSSSGRGNRPSSARSWMAVDGWLPARNPSPPPNPGKIKGKVDNNEEKLRRKENTQPHTERVTRDIGHGLLGVGHVDALDSIQASVARGQPWEDPDFAADKHALFFDQEQDDADIVWMRPKDLVSEPTLIADGLSRSDIMQGIIGDCWFLSSLAAVVGSAKGDLIKKIVPKDRQSLFGPDYTGAVSFQFWRFGGWVDVYVDDRLPTRNGKLIYARCLDPRELWVALVEKSYAKLHGSYEALEGGQAMDALVDLTGGLAERYELSEPHEELYRKFARAIDSGALITCSKKGDWKSSPNQETDEFGLVAGHAYTVTDLKRIKRQNGYEALVRVRNPWGMGQEWKGAWSDGDHRWNLVDQQTKQWLQQISKDDGEFWMSYKDLCKHFQEVTICTTGPDFDGDGTTDKFGEVQMLHGSWIANTTAGGCRNDIESFAKNPQYLLTVLETDDRDSSTLYNEEPRQTCSIVIGLMQEHRRSERHLGVKMLQIGFIIYKTEDSSKRLGAKHFMFNYETAKSGTYVNFREVCGRFELVPGRYVIIPSTYNRNEVSPFLLRVYAAKKIELIELPEYDALIASPAPPITPFEDATDELLPPGVVHTNHGHYGYGDDQIDPEIDRAMREDGMRSKSPSR